MASGNRANARWSHSARRCRQSRGRASHLGQRGWLPAARGLFFEILEARQLLAADPLVALPAGEVVANAAAAPTGLTPAQIRHAYGFDQIQFGSVFGDGSGQTIAIVDAYNDPNIVGDLHAFDVQFGLPDPPNFAVVGQDGTQNLPRTDPAGAIYLSGLNSSWSLEESMDVEWAHAMAPRANILLVEANNTSIANMDAAVSLAAGYAGVSVVSMSFGESEFAGETSDDSVFTTPAGHAGVTFIASTGDLGAPGEYQAYSPNVLAVGGTVLTLNASGNYASESGWGSSGGGVSQYEPKPSYQTNINGGSTPSTTRRTIPDVSFDAGTAIAVYDSFDAGPTPQGPNSWYGETGTSFSAPAWAGLIAVADQGRAVANLPALDGPSQTLPMLYQLPGTDFHDVVGGNNNGSSAVPGYDLVTGRGSPLANLVVQGLGAPAPNSVLTIQGDEDFVGESDTIKLELDAANHSLLDVYVNSTTPTYEVALASLSQIHVAGGGGGDTLVIDNSNGLISVAGGINFDGGSGADLIELLQTGGSLLTSDTFSVGTSVGAGSDVVIGSGGTQTLTFQSTGSLLDTLAAATESILGTAAADTITYAQASVPANGLITINGQLSLQFANKATLLINGGAGADNITLGNSNRPAGLVRIQIQATDPAASDKLVISDALGPVTVNLADVTSLGSWTTLSGYASPISLQGVAAAYLDAGGKPLTALDGTAGDTLAFTPASPTSGRLQPAALGTVFHLVDLGTAAGSLAIVAGGGNNTLNIQAANGGPLADDQVVVVSATSGSTGTVQTYTGGTPWASLAYQNVQNVLPNVASSVDQSNQLVIAPDANEPNDSLATATPLGSGASLQTQGVAIAPASGPGSNPAGDTDFYSVVAQQTGTIDFQALFSLFDPALLPGGGNLSVQAFDAAGDLIATASSGGAGPPGTVGSVSAIIPAVAGQTYYFAVFGVDSNGVPSSDVGNNYTLNVVDTAPPAPYNVQLSRGALQAGGGGPSPANSASDDSGPSASDNITRINTPTIYLQLDDGGLLNDLAGGSDGGNDGVATPGFLVAIFDGADSPTPVGFATPVGAASPGWYQYTFTSPLADGLHQILAAVEIIDSATPAAAGFGSDSAQPLDLTIDATPPAVYFGNSSTGTIDGLAPGSDSGTAGQPQTLTDMVTSVTVPTFFGYAEAGATIDVYALATAGAQAGQEILLGEATAAASGASPAGQWSLTTTIGLNSPAYFTLDGTRQLWVVATDLAGNASSDSAGNAGPGQTFNIVINTQGLSGGTLNGKVNTQPNQPPSESLPASSASLPVAVNENATLVFSAAGHNGIVIADPDAGTNPLQVTIAASFGTITTSGLPSLFLLAGTGVANSLVTVQGTLANINSALSALAFRPAPNYTGPDTITISVNDLGNTGIGGAQTAFGTIYVQVNAVPGSNLAPVNTLPVSQIAEPNGQLVFSTAGGNAISVADPDGGAAAEQIMLDTAGGKITLVATAGVTFVNNGSPQVTATGSLANLNAALNGMTFTPTPGLVGNASMQILTNDLGNTGAGGAQLTKGSLLISVKHVNQPPVNSVPSAQAVIEGASLTFNGAYNNQISVSDPDAAAGSSETVSLAASSGATLNVSAASNPGVVISGNNTGTLTLQGTLANLNAALNGLTFTPAANYSGPASLTLTTNDGGNTGSDAGTSGPQQTTTTIPITVDSVNPLAMHPGVANTLFVGGATSGHDLFLVVFTDSTHYRVTFDGLTLLAAIAPDPNNPSLPVYTTVNYVGHGAVANAAVIGNSAAAVANLYTSSFNYSGAASGSIPGYLVTGTAQVIYPAVWAQANSTVYEWSKAGATSIFTVWPTVATLAINGIITQQAVGFGHVYGLSIGSGDQSNLYAGAGATFTASPTSSQMQGAGYLNTVSGFQAVTGYGDSGGTSTADLEDSSGNDSLNAAGPTATLYTAAGAIYSANSFGTVQAIRSSGVDLAYVAAVDFNFEEVGQWTAVDTPN